MILLSGCVSVYDNLSLADDSAVELAGVVGHSDGECLFVAVERQVLGYSPRVPAGAVSAEGQGALGHRLPIGTADHDFGSERDRFS
jgi:hypothetical protein